MKTVFLLFLLLTLSSCSSAGFYEVQPSQHTVVFSALPRWLPIFSGGVEGRVLNPGEKELLLPWERAYTFTTGVQSIVWGLGGAASTKDDEVQDRDFVTTRSIDGNQVTLAMAVQFQVIPAKLPELVQQVGSGDEAVRHVVSAATRSQIRSSLNALRTAEFFNPTRRQEVIQQAEKDLRTLLAPEGIEVIELIYNGHRFERKLKDGKVDSRYQEQIDLTQAENQRIEAQEKIRATLEEQKRQELSQMRGRMKREVEQAEGFKRQALLRGESYLKARQSEAEQIRVSGLEQVEALKSQVQAFAGEGGERQLRLELARTLARLKAGFVVLAGDAATTGSGMGNEVAVTRIDANDFVRQLGVLSELVKDEKKIDIGEVDERKVDEKKGDERKGDE